MGEPGQSINSRATSPAEPCDGSRQPAGGVAETGARSPQPAGGPAETKTLARQPAGGPDETGAGSRQEADREKQRVAASSVLAAVLLTTLKIGAGIATGSLGILSEAAHSALDLVAAAVTWWAVKVSGRPADADHAYGHGKYENLSALFETVLLLATCAWIVWESLTRLLFEEVHVQANVWAFGVMAISIIVDVSRSRALKRAADKYSSQALEADALHFSSDIGSSAVVIVGLGLVAVSGRLGMPWLAKADAVAALGVACIVVWVSLQLGKRSLDALLDAVPPELRARLAAAARVDGVEELRLLRIRRSGAETFVDATLTVDRAAAFERAHDIASSAEAAIRREVPGADVVVHVEPVAATHRGLIDAIRLLAARHGLGAHGIRVYHHEGRRRPSVELHLEVDEKLNLRQAHAEATRFESRLRGTLPELDQIVSHLEPAGDSSAIRLAAPHDELPVRKALEGLLAKGPLSCHPHDVKVQRVGDELSVSFHCSMEPDAPIADAHALTEQVEKGLRASLPNLGRVVIHVEPPEGDV